MAATLDAALGTQIGHGANAVLSTGSAVSAGAKIIVIAGRFNSSATVTLSCSGGSLTWVADHNVTSGNLRIYIFRADAPSGLASGTNITVQASDVGGSDIQIGAGSFLGLDSGGPTAFNGGGATGTSWAPGTVGGNSGDFYIGGAFEDGSATATSTPTSPAVELYDFNNATQTEASTAAYKLSGNASDTVQGTWSTSVTHIRIAASYAVTAGGGGPVVKQLAALGVG